MIFAASAAECVRQADVLAITTPWAEFQELPLAAFQRTAGTLTVLDCWRVLPEQVAGIHRELPDTRQGRSARVLGFNGAGIVIPLSGDVLSRQHIAGFNGLLKQPFE